MVKSIYFLKPAWCGIHLAGLWPEQGLQPVTRATALQAVVFTRAETRHRFESSAIKTESHKSLKAQEWDIEFGFRGTRSESSCGIPISRSGLK
jgi:hypothetical protein